MSTMNLGRHAVRVTGTSILILGAPMAFGADESMNKLSKLKGGTIADNDSSAAPVTGDLNKSGQGVSAFVWGPCLAIVLGVVVCWMVIAIQKGGVFAAINSILALIFGAVGITLTYKYLIAVA